MIVPRPFEPWAVVAHALPDLFQQASPPMDCIMHVFREFQRKTDHACRRQMPTFMVVDAMVDGADVFRETQQ